MGCVESIPTTDYSSAESASSLLRVSQNTNSRAPQDHKKNSAKIVLLGDSGVGKSSLATRYCQGRFSPYHEVTIGAAFLQQMVRLADGTQLKLHLWDTGGQERFRSMAKLYYRDALGALIVFDCGELDSFESVKFWAKELKDKGPLGVKLAVVANKTDKLFKVQASEVRSSEVAGEGSPGRMVEEAGDLNLSPTNISNQDGSPEIGVKTPESDSIGVVAKLAEENSGDVQTAESNELHEGDPSVVDLEKAEQWCTENGMLFFRASAKTGEGVNQVFAKLANAVYEEVIKGAQ